MVAHANPWASVALLPDKRLCMTVYGLYLQEGTPLAIFDAVEVAPVLELPDGSCERLEESDLAHVRLETPDAHIFWSVYLHYDAQNPANVGFGGVECIADLPTEQAATEYAQGVEKAMLAVRNA